MHTSLFLALTFMFVSCIVSSGFVMPTTAHWGKTQVGMSTASVDVEQNGIVTVYHKTTCPYCVKALELLEGEYGLTVSKVDVLGEDSEKKIMQMKTFSGGRNTVPQIFFNSEHLGGNDDLQGLHASNELAALVEKVRREAPSMMKEGWYHPRY